MEKPLTLNHGEFMSKTVTITEALGEIKTIQSRIKQKQDSVNTHLFRQAQMRDPLEKSGGGSVNFVTNEMNAINDLSNQIIKIRSAVAKANEATQVTVCGKTQTISQWLVWKKEVAPVKRTFIDGMKATIHRARTNAMKAGGSVNPTESTTAADIVVNVNEVQLAKDSEELESILGSLDSQLSLKNATVMVEV